VCLPGTSEAPFSWTKGQGRSPVSRRSTANPSGGS